MNYLQPPEYEAYGLEATTEAAWLQERRQLLTRMPPNDAGDQSIHGAFANGWTKAGAAYLLAAGGCGLRQRLRLFR